MGGECRPASCLSSLHSGQQEWQSHWCKGHNLMFEISQTLLWTHSLRFSMRVNDRTGSSSKLLHSASLEGVRFIRGKTEDLSESNTWPLNPNKNIYLKFTKYSYLVCTKTKGWASCLVCLSQETSTGSLMPTEQRDSVQITLIYLSFAKFSLNV